MMQTFFLAFLLLAPPTTPEKPLDVSFDVDLSVPPIPRQFAPIYVRLAVRNDSERRIALPAGMSPYVGLVEYRMWMPGIPYSRGVPDRYAGERYCVDASDHWLPPKSAYVVYEQLWFDFESLNQPLLSEAGRYGLTVEFRLGPSGIRDEDGNWTRYKSPVWLRTDTAFLVRPRPEDERAFLEEFFQIGDPADERIHNRRRFVQHIPPPAWSSQEAATSWEDNDRAVERLGPGPLRRRLRFNLLIAAFDPKGEGPEESARKELDELLDEMHEIERTFLIIDACRRRLEGWKQYDLVRHLASKLPDVPNGDMEAIHNTLERVGK